MANQGSKKIVERNRRRMDLLWRIILVSNVIYIVVRMAVMHSSFTWKHWIGLVVTSAAYFLSYKQLASMTKAEYSDADNRELLSSGYDMATGGISEYIEDVIYITAFVQLTSIISGKFWWTYLVIPAFGGYKIFFLLKGTFFSGGSEGEVEDEKSRKKREKMEKKASRGKMVKTRTR
ncbi:transmembrane protein 208 homolog [Hordeum vulgare subsp. vulgare]|uniref:Transmembrane protein 208 n=1 Tax=Hordeum vulgare subsp. vulgare TaxID=112509 RepID=A0A8I6YVL6_HORVV|nr:transmembrane protein 208 homolog [Hordeum vulgare subsp. vulgare]